MPIEFLQGFAVQVLGATIVSNVIGYMWYSKSLFGELWWSHTFPGVVFGNCAAIKPKTNSVVLPPYASTFVSIICASVILTTAFNAIMPISSAGLQFPFFFAAAAAGVNACVSLPHYAYPRKPLVLYMIGTGHNTLQIFASVFLIYLFSNHGNYATM